MSKLTIKTEGDRFVVVTRRFAAKPEAVYRAHTEPALVQKWMLGPEGWTMPVCISEARPGGKIRYEWAMPGGGGFYLTEYQEELEAFYDIDREIVCYRSKEELLDKIRFYLRHPARRVQIREAGRRRCLSEHTWAKRFEKVFREMGVTN